MARKTNTQKASVKTSPAVELPKPAEELNGKKVKQPKAEKQPAVKVEKVLADLATLTKSDEIGIRFFPADGTTAKTKVYKASALEHAQNFAIKFLGEGWETLKTVEGRVELANITKKEFLTPVQKREKADITTAIIAKAQVQAQMTQIEDTDQLVEFAEAVGVENPSRYLDMPNAGLIKMNLVNTISGHVSQGLKRGLFSVAELQKLGFTC